MTPSIHASKSRDAARLADRRRHKRVNATLLGRFMRFNKQEYPCKLVDISVGGAAMMSPVTVDDDERIVAYFDYLGGIEGKVARSFEGGFAIRLAVTAHKREKLAAQLTWLVNRSGRLVADDRLHSRSLPGNEQSTLQLDEGIVVPCRVMDISVSGASLDTQARPEIGREVLLGKLRARVTRHHAGGIGVQFLDIQYPAALRRHFG